MDSLGKDIPRQTAMTRNMIEAILYTVREQQKMLKNAEEQLLFFKEQLEGKAPEEEL